MTKNKLNKRSGQILLIAVMLIAVLLTVVFSAAFVSRTDTQISKLEEENQKALAAAEAGIEAALKSGSIATFTGVLNIPSGFTGSASVSSTRTSSFTTPLIKKGDQYSFYLSTTGGSPDAPLFTSLGAPYYNGDLTLCSTSNAFAMSVALLKSDGTIRRYIINPPAPQPLIISNARANGLGTCPAGLNFVYRHYLNSGQIGADNLVLFVRLVGSGTGAKIGFNGNTIFPLQGKTIVSEAKSPTGVTKTIQLFQSYPQIPAEFFVTSF